MNTSGARLLVVEDDDDVRRGLELLLRAHGYDVRSRADGRAGLQAVVDDAPQLVLLDVGLPELDGWQVLERLRRISSVPVLMLTAEGGEDGVVHGLRAGADDYLTKPYRGPELLARVAALLRRQGQGCPPAPAPAAENLVSRVRTRRPRLLVADDDPDIRRMAELVLTRRGGFTVTTVGSGEEALAALESGRSWDAVVSDVHMGGMSGLELASAVRAAHPVLPTVLVTGDAQMSTAVAAVRAGAADFVAKPVRPAELVATVTRVVDQVAGRRARVLAIGAHPDDVEIGVGGTLLGHVRRGDEVTVLTLSAGATGGQPEVRRQESLRAAELLDANLYLAELEDTRIPQGRPTIDVVETVVAAARPWIVYVHSGHDAHQDHRAVHAATMVGSRRIAQVLGYRSPSATVDFRPTRFVDVTAVIDEKVALISAYASQAEQRDYLADDLLRAQARVHGSAAGATYAEPLEVLRDSLPSAPTARTPDDSRVDA